MRSPPGRTRTNACQEKYFLDVIAYSHAAQVAMLAVQNLAVDGGIQDSFVKSTSCAMLQRRITGAIRLARAARAARTRRMHRLIHRAFHPLARALLRA